MSNKEFHAETCDVQKGAMFTNYGSDCTCGQEELVSLLKRNQGKSVDAIAKALRERFDWYLK